MAEQTNSQFLNTPSNTLIVANVDIDEGGTSKTTKPVVLGAVQQFAYQVLRLKAPIYVIGSTNPITIAKGARQVAGTLLGVILSKDFLVTLLELFWKNVDTVLKNGLYRVNGTDDINLEFGDMTLFINHFVIPFINLVNGSETDIATFDSKNFEASLTKKLFDNSVGKLLLKIPPLYLDEIPPINLSLITPIEIDSGGLKYETVTLYGLEFVSNDLAIQAGRELIFESVNFILKSVAKSIATQGSLATTTDYTPSNVDVAIGDSNVTVTWQQKSNPTEDFVVVLSVNGLEVARKNAKPADRTVTINYIVSANTTIVATVNSGTNSLTGSAKKS